jgi:uncharacterized SAM-binding protein YcdF (DUF218 family)
VSERSSKEQPKPGWGLFRRRKIAVPTLRGCLLIILICGGLLFALVRTIHPFLAVNAPVTGGVLVIEGWAPDYALEAAADQVDRDHYEKLFVTGEPLEYGSPLSEYRTTAEVSAATLLKLGLGSNLVQAVPGPRVRRDRTYSSAVALKKWFEDHGTLPAKINLLTVGPHARRSRLMFEKAFGKGVSVGVTALPVRDYDPKRWYRSSQGFRVVTGEALAYCYARLLFRAPKP